MKARGPCRISSPFREESYAQHAWAYELYIIYASHQQSERPVATCISAVSPWSEHRTIPTSNTHDPCIRWNPDQKNQTKYLKIAFVGKIGRNPALEDKRVLGG